MFKKDCSQRILIEKAASKWDKKERNDYKLINGWESRENGVAIKKKKGFEERVEKE